jgi:hypothetical protein
MVDYYDAKWKIKVVAEIQRWSQDVLQIPSGHFNGLPPCPYAQAAWANSKVKIDFGDVDTVLNHVKNWDDRNEWVIVVLDMDIDLDNIEPWCDYQNDMLAKKDFALMPFVPDQESVTTGQPDEELTAWEPIVEDEYAMVFVQRLSDVNEASESLENSGYYKNCTAEFLKYVHDRRERERNARKQEEDHGQEEEVARILQEREGHRQGYVAAGEDAGQEEGQQEERQEDAARSACCHEEEGQEG